MQSDKPDRLTETLARMWTVCDPNRGGTNPDEIISDGSSELVGKPRWHWFIPRAEASKKFLELHGFKFTETSS